MNDEFEKLIINNLETIQDVEPNEGHLERFRNRLQKKPKNSLKKHLISGLKVAAVIVFVLLAANQTRLYFFNNKPELISLGSISEEYREVEFYYVNSIQTGIKQCSSFMKEGVISETEYQTMLKEQEEFDKMYLKLIKDLEANPNDERVINAMLEYYQTRMNIISMIINKLNDVKQQKSKNNETKI